MTEKDRDRLLQLAARRSLMTAAEVAREGIHSYQVSRLVREGRLERVGRGRYRLPEVEPTEHHGLVIASTVAPRSVICLLSALGFHGIGTQLPFEVWLAIERRARRPALEYPPLRVVRISGRAFTEGIERHEIEGREVRIYSVAKTLADLFKFRNTVGLDVALEALRDSWHARRFTVDELQHHARICRVERVIRPYVEALVGGALWH